MNDKEKNIKLNMILSAIKSLLSVIFPLITFPYISRVLQVDNIGKINFAASIVSYFQLIARLGINDYAVKEGAKLKGTDKFKPFCNEIFSINIISTVVSYVLLSICIAVSTKLKGYAILLIIQSLTILFTTIGREWLYMIYEDYLYITVRAIVVQILSIVAMFLFVKEPKDYIVYAAISVIASCGANVFNLIKSQKVVPIKIKITSYSKKIIKPILLLFSTTVSVAIFTNLDTTILGIVCSDYNVGIYATSVKIYNILVSVLVSVIFVVLPRMSKLTVNEADKGKLTALARETNDLLVSFVLPIAVGIIVLAPEIITVIAGEAYLDAVVSLRILSCAFFCCTMGTFLGECILLPYNREDVMLYTGIASALMNLVLNILLIPVWKQDAAAFTTLLSQLFGWIVEIWTTRKYLKIDGVMPVYIKSMIGCAVIAVVCIIAKRILDNVVMIVIVSVFVAATLYIVIETLINNMVIRQLVASLYNKLKNRKRA